MYSFPELAQRCELVPRPQSVDKGCRVQCFLTLAPGAELSRWYTETMVLVTSGMNSYCALDPKGNMGSLCMFSLISLLS